MVGVLGRPLRAKRDSIADLPAHFLTDPLGRTTTPREPISPTRPTYDHKSDPLKDEKIPLCRYHGKVCSKGACKVYEEQLWEQRERPKSLDKSLELRWLAADPPSPILEETEKGARRFKGKEKVFGPRSPRDGNFL